MYIKYQESKAANADVVALDDVQGQVKLEKARSEIRHNWKQIVRVYESGGEQLGITGGFRDVQIRVSNDCDYPLENVIVLIRLENMFRMCYTEKLKIDYVPSNGEHIENFTHTSCGQKIHVDIMGFQCPQLKYELTPPD